MNGTRIVSALVAAAAVGFGLGAWLAGGEGADLPAAVNDAPALADAGADAAPDAGTRRAGSAPAPAEGTTAGARAPLLTLADIEALLAALPAAERDTWLADAGALGRLVDEESALRSVLAAAEVNRALEDPLTALLVQRSRDRTLVDLYLARVVRANLSPDWPSAVDVEKLISSEPERFRLPERVPVWQVFLPVAADADAAAVSAVRGRARELATLLRKGKAEFALVAEEHSAHAPSRAAGGYMGLVAVAELLPEVRELAHTLAPGAVSDPVQTAQGFHIVRFGERQAARALPADEARALARQLLLREATVAIREAALAKIRESHPVTIAAEEIDAWHQALLSRDWSGSGSDTVMAPGDTSPRSAASAGLLARPPAALARPTAE
jgi:peptidylprolyl isomerase